MVYLHPQSWTEWSLTTENQEEGVGGRAEVHLGFDAAATRGRRWPGWDSQGRCIHPAAATFVMCRIWTPSGPGVRRPRVPTARPRRSGRPHDCVRTLSVPSPPSSVEHG